LAKFEIKVNGDCAQISSRLNSAVLDSGVSVNLVDSSRITVGDTSITVRVYDKYFARNGNRASLTLTVAGNRDETYVSAIGAGGGSGAFFNFSLGAEDDFVETVARAMRSMGY
jgi:hypothetical protein